MRAIDRLMSSSGTFTHRDSSLSRRRAEEDRWVTRGQEKTPINIRRRAISGRNRITIVGDEETP